MHISTHRNDFDECKQPFKSMYIDREIDIENNLMFRVVDVVDVVVV
jgi:hypothetical protein